MRNVAYCGLFYLILKTDKSLVQSTIWQWAYVKKFIVQTYKIFVEDLTSYRIVVESD